MKFVSTIYFDNNATTQLDPRVCDAVVHVLKNSFGNPSSIHSYGQEARGIVNKARRTVADFLGVKPAEIIFTSGGTEAINMALRGFIEDNSNFHILTSSVEHSSVFRTVSLLEKRGCTATFLNPGFYGAIRAEAVKEAIQHNTKMIVLTAVNSETGVKTDIDAIAAIAEEARIPFVVDGVQLLGKEPFSIPAGVAAMAFSSHKLHGPKGVGCLFVRSKLKLTPLLIGGEQEFGRRGGTENVAGIAGFAEAVSLLKNELNQAKKHMQHLRDRLERELKTRIPDIYVNGEGPRVANTTNLSFDGIEGETLLAKLDLLGLAVSHGSACSSGAIEPSRVLLNMGIPRLRASSAIRVSLSRFNREEEVDAAIELICDVVSKLRR